jgi:F420-non-reducing hydrogenase iron-sulfur subunit
MKALVRGIDGVFVGGCHPGECHYMKGNYYARRRMVMIKKLAEKIGIEPERIRLEWVSASEGQKFAQTVEDFTRTIQKLGPNPLRKERYQLWQRAE